MSFDTFCHLRIPWVHSLRPRQSVRVIGVPKLLLPNHNRVATSKTKLNHPQGNGQHERYNRIVRMANQCMLHFANRPLSDWECVLPSALSSIRTLISTITKESPHDRFFCFKRGELLIRHSKSAPWLKADSPAYLKKFIRAKDQAPVVPVQKSEVISSHLARVSFGDERVDTVSTSYLFQRPPDVDNEGRISQPGDHNVDL